MTEFEPLQEPLLELFDFFVADEEIYGNWKSLDVMLSEPSKPTVVGRWDWHAWQALISLIPAGLVYWMAQWARRDMEKQSILAQKEQENVEEPKGTRFQVGPGEMHKTDTLKKIVTEEKIMDLRERIDIIEKTLDDLRNAVLKQNRHQPSAATQKLE